MARCVGLSPYSEAERVNAAETNGVSKMDVPELHAVGRPRNAAELLRNRRSFANAIANCIGSVKYAGRSLVSLVSFPGIPHSEDIPDAERLAARHIMALKSEEKKKHAPLASTVLPTLKYMELHSFAVHYSFQIRRNSCKLATRLGRLCCRRDYAPCESTMPFLPCDERTYVGPEPDWHFLPMPVWRDGRFAHWDEVKAGLADGTIGPEHKYDPPSIALKQFYKEKSKNPPMEVKVGLAEQLLNSSDERRVAIVNTFFDTKRNDEFVAELVRRENAANVETRVPGEDELEPVVLRILDGCASQVAALRGVRETKRRCKELLDDPRVGLSSLGSGHELIERVYEHRAHICSMFSLKSDDVYAPPPRTR
jgi:hypothetical protein